MQDIETVKEGGKEYIVIKLKENDSFAGRMLTRNKIGSLLSASQREFNGEAYIYNDISGRVRFCEMFAGENDIMEKDDIERICQSFTELIQDLKDYLLDAWDVKISPETLFFNPEKKKYEFLYIPDQIKQESKEDKAGEETNESFKEGVKSVWDRVMEKFNHQSDIDTISRVYDIYQKVSMANFDPEEVFAPVKKEPVKSEEIGKSQKSEQSAFDKDTLKETIAVGGNRISENVNNFSEVKEVLKDTKQSEKIKRGSIFEGFKQKLSDGTAFFGINTERDKKIEEISRNMEEEEKIGFKVKNYLTVNSGNIFKVFMCISVLFLVLALLPGSVSFKPPMSACVGVFLVCVAVAVYARKLGKEREEEEREATG